MATCNVCSQPANSRCSRCNETAYCARDHQVVDWPKHKIICRSPANLKAIFDRFTARIIKNILVMAEANNAMDLIVEISETLDQFILSDMHFIHLSCYDPTVSRPESLLKKIVIYYKTTDYHYQVTIDQPNDKLPNNLQDIKPGPEWSILVE